MRSVEARNVLLRSRSRISRQATRVIARRPVTCDQLQEELVEGGRPVVELDDSRATLRSGKHLLRIDIPPDEKPQVAVAALDEFDAGDLRQPLRQRALELQLDPTALRGPSQRGEIAVRDDAAVVDDRDLLADVLDQIQLMAREDDGSAAHRLVMEDCAQACATGSRPAKGSSRTAPACAPAQRRAARAVGCRASSSTFAPARSPKPSRSSQSVAAARASRASNPCRRPK